MDRTGNLYFADAGNHRVRKISTDGIIQTIAGNGLAGNYGDGGPAAQAAIGSTFFSIRAVTIDANGTLYIAVDNLVRKVSTDGIITTVAGTEVAKQSGDGGLAVDTELVAPIGVAVDKAGNLYIAETSDRPRIRKVSVDGTISTVAGGHPKGFSGDGGPATDAALSALYGVAIDANGNLFIADWGNNRVRRVSTAGIIETLAGNPYRINSYAGDGGIATDAELTPSEIAALRMEVYTSLTRTTARFASFASLR